MNPKNQEEEETPPKRSHKIKSNQKQKDQSYFEHKLVQFSSKLNSSSEDKNLPFVFRFSYTCLIFVVVFLCFFVGFLSIVALRP